MVYLLFKDGQYFLDILYLCIQSPLLSCRIGYPKRGVKQTCFITPKSEKQRRIYISLPNRTGYLTRISKEKTYFVFLMVMEIVAYSMSSKSCPKSRNLHVSNLLDKTFVDMQICLFVIYETEKYLCHLILVQTLMPYTYQFHFLRYPVQLSGNRLNNPVR